MAATGSKDYQRKAHFTLIWDIENWYELFFSECVESPTFITESIENINWVTSIRFSFTEEKMELGIRRTDFKGPNSIEIEFELSILNEVGFSLNMQTYKKQFKGGDECWFELEDCVERPSNQEAMSCFPLTVRCRMWRKGTEISKPDTCFARTRLAGDRCIFVWDIRDFSSLQSGQKRTHVVKPSLKGMPRLILSLFLSERNGKTFLNIEITKPTGDRCPTLLCGLSLLNNDGKVVHSTGKMQAELPENSQDVYIFQEFFEKEKLGTYESSLVHNDVLYIRCTIVNRSYAAWSRIEHYTYIDQKKTKSLAVHFGGEDESCTIGCLFKKAFEELYGDESLIDVSLRAGTKSFTAHKNVLSVRSPVFKAMFSHDMKEKSSKIVDIPDFNADTLSRLLLYIYKNTVNELQWESAMDLYRAADKYQLLDLRKKCSFFLESNLSTINVCSLLSLGVMHEDGVLRKAAEDFISEHDVEVFDSAEWKNFREENFRLAFEIMEKIICLIKRRNR